MALPALVYHALKTTHPDAIEARIRLNMLASSSTKTSEQMVLEATWLRHPETRKILSPYL